MSIEVTCRCGNKFRVKDKYAGKTGKCPSCGVSIRVPSDLTQAIAEMPTQALPKTSKRKAKSQPAVSTSSVSATHSDAADAVVRAALSVQKATLPQQPPELAACELGTVLQSAPVPGGDYYDFFPLQDGTLAIAIGDATGHGLGAAMLMAQARVCLRALAQAYSDVGTIFTLANRVFAAGMPDDLYATLTLARLDLNTRLLSYASAGHPTGYVLDPQGKVKWSLESTDCPLGLLAQTMYGTSQPLRLEPGDLVLFVTGGILKARAADGTLFGAERMLAVVEANHQRPAQAIAEALCQAARGFCGSPGDDLTAVVMRAR